MTTMIRELYEALKEAGASEEKATAAASVLLGEFLHRDDTSELATQSTLRAVEIGLKEDFRKVEIGLKEELKALDIRLAVVERELEIVRWIVSGVGFGVLLLVIRSFWPGG